MTRRSAMVLMIPVLAILTVACSGESAAGPAISSAETTASSTAAASPAASLDEAEVARLWQETLTIFEAGTDEREQRAAELPDQLPVDEALRLSELYFVTGEELDLTSNAVYSPRSDGTVEIVDCADSSGPSVLGPTTAGFKAVAGLSPTGDVEISGLEAVPRCVQRGPGQAALDNYELFVQATDDLWTDPRIDHPAIGNYATRAAAEASRAYLTELEDLGLLDDTIVNHESVRREVEIVGYRPNEITLRDCQHGDETFGIFNGAGERVDQLGPPWRVELVVKMVKVDGEWLFDELINRIEGDCQMGTTAAGLQLL